MKVKRQQESLNPYTHVSTNNNNVVPRSTSRAGAGSVAMRSQRNVQSSQDGGRFSRGSNRGMFQNRLGGSGVGNNF